MINDQIEAYVGDQNGKPDQAPITPKHSDPEQ